MVTRPRSQTEIGRRAESGRVPPAVIDITPDSSSLDPELVDGRQSGMKKARRKFNGQSRFWRRYVTDRLRHYATDG
jgi:hypothetical protein